MELHRALDKSSASIAILQIEIERLCGYYVGILLVGDANVHHKRLLKHFNSNTELGERLWKTCRDLGLNKICLQTDARRLSLGCCAYRRSGTM